MSPAPPVAAETPLAEVLPRLADGREPLVPFADAGRLVGVVSRSDIVALLLPGVVRD
jgi:CBS domain-containing membrane protein